MKFPFVSRERFEDERERAQKLEQENKTLIAQLAEARAAHSASPLPKDQDLTWQPIPGKPTIATVVSFANHEAMERAKTPGAKGISQELREQDENLMKRFNG